MNREGKKCVLYIRVSTEMQVEGYSLDAQKTTLNKYAEREGLKVINIYEDAGKSGKSIEGSPAFQKMMNDVSNGLDINYILVYKLSRFGRNAADILNSLELLQSYDINLISVNEGLDSSQAMGKVFISLLSSMSELERENILEQTMNGRKEKARQGGWNGGFAPYGYKLEEGKLLIADDEAEAIRLIFKLYTEDDYGFDRIAKELNLRGIKKKLRQNNTIELWTANIVRNIINNPVYAGKIAYGRRGKEKVKGKKNEYKSVINDEFILADGPHEAFITEEVWNVILEKKKMNGQKDSLIGSNRVHFLSGLIKCPRCGGPMYASKYYYRSKKGTYKEHYFYECFRRKTQRGRPCDCKLRINKPLIEPYLIALIKGLINNDLFINKVAKIVGAKTDSENLVKMKEQFETKLKEVLENKKRIEFELDNMPLDAKHRERKIESLNSRLDDLYDVIDDLETRINDVEVKMESIELGKITNEKILASIKSFDELYKLMTDEEKKEAISGIVKEIYINETPASNNNYINRVILKFDLFYEDNVEMEISGEVLDDLPDLSKDYIENTSIEIPSNKAYKNHYVKKNKVTYKKIQEYILEHYGLKVHTTYIAEIKRKNGIDMQADRHNKKFKYDCPKNKAEAITEALKYYKVI